MECDHSSVTDPASRLADVLALENETERKLAVVALIDELVQRIGFRAIVIGGLAVEFWTHGAYSTADIDLYLPHGPAVDALLGELGFEKRGRHWVIEQHELFVEAPASVPADEEEVYEVTLRSGLVVAVLSPADVLVDRLHQFVAGGHRDVASQSVTLLGADQLDTRHLARRLEQEGLEAAYRELVFLGERIDRGETIESWELHDMARRLRRG